MTDETRHPLLARLDQLVGRWETAASDGERVLARGMTAFAWLDGGRYLAQRDTRIIDDETDPFWAEHSPRSATLLIGLDDGAERFGVLYSDARSVHRVYQMTFTADGEWTVWRDQPGFDQRYVGRLDVAAGTITGSWEKRTDGTTWTPDFGLTYRRLG